MLGSGPRLIPASCACEMPAPPKWIPHIGVIKRVGGVQQARLEPEFVLVTR